MDPDKDIEPLADATVDNVLQTYAADTYEENVAFLKQTHP